MRQGQLQQRERAEHGCDSHGEAAEDDQAGGQDREQGANDLYGSRMLLGKRPHTVRAVTECQRPSLDLGQEGAPDLDTKRLDTLLAQLDRV